MLLTFAQNFSQGATIASGLSPTATNLVGTATTQSQAAAIWFIVAN